MSERREFMKAGAALSLLARLGLDVASAEGMPAPPVADRLDQGPFGIAQDEGWYVRLLAADDTRWRKGI